MPDPKNVKRKKKPGKHRNSLTDHFTDENNGRYWNSLLSKFIDILFYVINQNHFSAYLHSLC